MENDCEWAEPITVLVENARLFFYRKVERPNARHAGTAKSGLRGEYFGRRKISTQR
jgi:hypothetical protein